MKNRQITILVLAVFVLFVLDISRTETRVDFEIDEHPSIAYSGKTIDQQRYYTISKNQNFGVKFNVIPIRFQKGKKPVQKVWEQEFEIGSDSTLIREVHLSQSTYKNFAAWWFGRGEGHATALISDKFFVNCIKISEIEYELQFDMQTKGWSDHYDRFYTQEVDKVVQKYLLDDTELKF